MTGNALVPFSRISAKRGGSVETPTRLGMFLEGLVCQAMTGVMLCTLLVFEEFQECSFLDKTTLWSHSINR